MPAQFLKLVRATRTLCQLRVPVRPYANFEAFRRYQCHYAYLDRNTTAADDPTFYPCLGCEATGKIIEPGFRPCPVEGYKGAPRIRCPRCQGSRRGDRKTLLQAYRNRIALWEQERAEFDARLDRLKQACAKLSDEELSTLQYLLDLNEHPGSCEKTARVKTLKV